MGAAGEEIDDCMRCAACCHSESPRHARVTGADYARLGDDADRLVTWIGNQAFMRLTHAAGESAAPRRCIALTIDDRTGRFACSIYEERPEVCRALERGSGACLGERATKGERPRRSLALLARARA